LRLEVTWWREHARRRGLRPAPPAWPGPRGTPRRPGYRQFPMDDVVEAFNVLMILYENTPSTRPPSPPGS
jgi:hypothetical protein